MRAPDRTLSLAGDVLAYWRALGGERWFVKDAAVDAEIRYKFQGVYRAAVAGSLGHWRNDASGARALTSFATWSAAPLRSRRRCVRGGPARARRGRSRSQARF